jgi:hypothetical protein
MTQSPNKYQVIYRLFRDITEHHKYFSELVNEIDQPIVDNISKKTDQFYQQLQFKTHIALQSEEPFWEIIAKKIETESLLESIDNYNNWSNLIWGSLFLRNYGFYESRLNILAYTIGEIEKSKLQPSDLKHSGIKRTKIFLTNVINHGVPIKEEMWEKFESLNQIRNLLIHNDGSIIKGGQNVDRKTRQFIENEEGIAVNKTNILDIQKEFVTNSENFMLNIHQRICEYFIELDENY